MSDHRRSLRLTNLAVIAGSLVVLGGCFDASRDLIQVPLENEGNDSQQVAIIDVHAAIEAHTAHDHGFVSMGGGAADAEDLCLQLREAARDKHVKAIILDLDSGGGDVTGTMMVAQQVDKVRSGGKPVVAVMGSVCASGAYYIAAGSERIFTSPTTITGSIGAIFMSPDLHKLLEGPLGIGVNVIKSGPFKDIGSPARPMTDEENKLIKAIVDNAYEHFVAAVAAGRRGHAPVPADVDGATKAVRALADGRIFSGDQALAAGLADESGYLFDAVDYLVRTQHLDAHPQLVRYGRDLGLFGGVVTAAAQPTHINAGLEINAGAPMAGALAPRLEYRWYGK